MLSTKNQNLIIFQLGQQTLSTMLPTSRSFNAIRGFPSVLWKILTATNHLSKTQGQRKRICCALPSTELHVRGLASPSGVSSDVV